MKKIIVGLLLLFAVLGLVYKQFIYRPADLGKAHGTVDIQDSLLSFERPGRIIILNADEGTQVKEGDVLAVLDSEALKHQISIQKASCSAEKALLDQYRSGYLKEEREKAEAAVRGAESAVSLARITYERTESLLKSRSVSRQEFDSAKAAFEQSKAQLAESRAALALIERGYREELIAAQSAKVAACTDQIAYLSYQEEVQGYIRAPFSGTIRSRNHELFDFVGAGETVFALTDENRKRLRIYLSEKQLNLIKTGDTVKVETATGGSVSGTVSFISPTAMFTPKTVQTEDLRADLVYEVNVDVSDPNRVLRFGQAVTVILKEQ